MSLFLKGSKPSRRGFAQEAVSIAVCVIVVSRDCSCLVDGLAFGGYGARGIECGERAGLLAIQLQARNQKGNTGYFPNPSRSLELFIFAVIELTSRGFKMETILAEERPCSVC